MGKENEKEPHIVVWSTVQNILLDEKSKMQKMTIFSYPLCKSKWNTGMQSSWERGHPNNNRSWQIPPMNAKTMVEMSD